MQLGNQAMDSWKRTLYVLMFVQFVSAAGMNSIFPFLPLYVEELGSSTGLSVELLAGLVFSAQAFTMMIAGPLWGALADRHGRKLMVERATLGGSVIVFLMAFARTGEDLVILRAIQGVITGIVSAITALVAANVPRERTGTALGMLQMGLWSGLAVGPLVGGVIADVAGFRAAIVLTAALLATAGALTWWGVEEAFEPLPKSQIVPGGLVGMWTHILASDAIRMVYLSRFLSRLGRTMIMPFVALMVADLMTNPDRAASVSGTLIGVGAALGTLTALVSGRWGDRVGHRRVLAIMGIAAALVYLPMTFTSTIWPFAILLVLASAATGGIFPTLSAVLATYTEHGEEGAVYGLENSIMAAARTISPLLGAVLAGVFGLHSLFLVAAALLLGMAFIAGRWLPDPTPSTASSAAQCVTPAPDPAK
jgi:DHA1 family multidrug resistance protein-like MFS transporter